jgi:DNA-binding PadR family transcriptional regulator
MFHSFGFTYGGAWETFGNSIIEGVILDYLKDKSARGSDIAKEAEKSFFWCFAPAIEKVHAMLKMLTDMGYITCTEQNGEKLYTITEEGKEYHRKRGYSFPNISQEMKDCFRDMRDGRFPFEHMPFRGFPHRHYGMRV